MVSAWATGNGIVLGQQKTEEKFAWLNTPMTNLLPWD